MAERVPTGPGWWWRKGNHGPYIEEVDGDQNHAPFLAIDGSDVVDDGTWLAPIPGPAVLAALAEYGDALVALDACGEARQRRLLAGEVAPFSVVAEATEDAEDCAERLADAIRAERDGAA